MIAVLKIGGKQYFVKENQILLVDRLDNKVGDALEFPALLVKDSSLKLGKEAENQPIIATVLEHLKGKKIRIAKFKAKSRYRRIRGFRPFFTKIKIVSIGGGTGEKELKQSEIPVKNTTDATPQKTLKKARKTAPGNSKSPSKKRGRPSKKVVNE